MQKSKTESLFLPKPVLAGAVISECGKYRYSLTRIWDESKPNVMFVMLNPSTADGIKDDPTIRRCVGFAKSWGFGSLVVCNLFAFRATSPRDLLNAHNPFGDQNIWHTRQLFDKVQMVICAWGNKPIVDKICGKGNQFETLDYAYEKLHYLELSNEGTPKHPLYLKSDLTPKRLELHGDSGLFTKSTYK